VSEPSQGEGCLVESHRRLSESLLWKLQRAFYEQRGVEAWNKGTVPHYITNNSFIAWTYARVLRGVLTDLERSGLANVEQPVYIVELGCGAGRFSYLLLKHLTELTARRGNRLRFCYVMTDLVAKNLDFWQRHERLRPFYEQGVLDLASFDAERDSTIRLQRSGVELCAATLANPLIVLGNYVFDTLTFDAFRVQNGVMQQSLVALRSSREAEPDLDVPELLTRLTTEYEHSLVEGDYYPDKPVWNQLLNAYAGELGDTSIAFPVGALRCIDRLMELSGGRLLLMSADKAFNRVDELLWRDDPAPVVHGSFSLTANFEAMGRYFHALGPALTLFSSPRPAGLQMTLQVALAQHEQLTETRLEFVEAVDGFGPMDFFTFKDGYQLNPGTSLKHFVDLLRLSQWDHRTMCELSETMFDKVGEASDAVKRQLRYTLSQVWSYYYPIGDVHDVAFCIGRFLYRLEHYRESLLFYHESLRQFGEHTTTHFNIGLCHFFLRERAQAIEHLERSLQLDVSNAGARSWLLQIRAELAEVPDHFASV
jgi:tetratricopeptide (TPR) repeat protein